MEMRVSSAIIQDHEEKLRKELKSTAEGWRWKFNLPQKPNYNNVYFYKKSKKIFNAPCYDLDLDRPPENYRGEFLQVKQVLHQTEFRLRHAQEEAKKKKQDLIQEWKELEVKENELRDNFIQFNRFLTRNITKRTRAEQKFQEMNALKLDCAEKILDMRKESGDITEFIEKLKKRVLTHKVYENYLNIVVMTGSFKTIPHIINRYVLLEETKQTVGQQMNQTSEEFHNRRMIYVKMIETLELTYLSLSNELSEMRRKYDDAKYRTNAWEVVLEDICNKYALAAQNISWSRMALRHMFDMAFFRIRRRRRRLVKTKKDDLGKMLRVNETLKALERIESQLRKLQGQKNVGTSMDPEREAFEIKERSASKPAGSVLMRKWKAKQRQTVPVKGGHQTGDLAGYLKLTAQKLDDVCPIRLGMEKWKHAKVRNFEEHYRKALLAISEEKTKERNQDFLYGGMDKKVSYVSLTNSKSHKTKWAAAAVAQKIIKDVTIDAHLPTPTTSTSILQSATSDSALTVFEDGDDLLGDFTTAAKRLQMKKLIERKFTELLDGASSREPHDKDKEKISVTLPSILSGYQTKERDFVRKKIQEVSSSPYATKQRATFVETDGRVTTFEPTKLPPIYNTNT